MPLKKDIRYVPTPIGVVEAMLDLAKLIPGDILYDLGSGDGRLVIASALRGTPSVGIEIDPTLVARSRESAKVAGVSHLTEFRICNFFDADITQASVVVLYLLDKVNKALLPRLLKELKTGSRLVSHSFEMGEWLPEQSLEVETKFIHQWTIPELDKG